jgi:hypothetical protein
MKFQVPSSTFELGNALPLAIFLERWPAMRVPEFELGTSNFGR